MSRAPFSCESQPLLTTSIQFDPATNELKLVQSAAGSSGVVSLEFNQDKTVLVGAAFGQGQVDVWDVSAADGTLKVMFQPVHLFHISHLVHRGQRMGV